MTIDTVPLLKKLNYFAIFWFFFISILNLLFFFFWGGGVVNTFPNSKHDMNLLICFNNAAPIYMI